MNELRLETLINTSLRMKNASLVLSSQLDLIL